MEREPHVGMPRSRVFDTRALAAGSVLGGGVALLLARRWLRADQDLGPTAGALSDGFNMLFATLIGIVIAGVAGACLARGTARLLVGLLAAVGAYLLTAIALAVTVEASDISLWERIREWLFWLPVWLPFMVIAAAIGWCIRALGQSVSRAVTTRKQQTLTGE
ncbi:MAG TPA: hypothetical protein VH063_10755 [Gaiellaceae bacterium]|jgi:hypothetical protein|nr:hypothetical protein [Gaiellaceae bacterium]